MSHTVKLDLRLEPSRSILRNLTDLDSIVLLSGITEPSKVFAEKNIAQQVNVEGMQRLIKFAIERNAKLFFFSSVEVFGEKDAPHDENSSSSPLNAYGEMKDKNEEVIRREFPAGKYSIIRTPWIVNPVMGSRCVITQTAKGIISGKMKFASDYLVSLVSAEQVLDGLEVALTKLDAALPKHLHFVSKGFTSRFDLACQVGRILLADRYKVQEGKFDDLILNEPRSRDTRMVSIVTWKEPFNPPEHINLVLTRQLEVMKLRGDFND